MIIITIIIRHYYRQGTAIDVERATRYFILAADKGDARGQYNLGK